MLFFKRKTAKSIGQLGEDAAAKYLKKLGYKIIERNFKNHNGRQVGEIDIISQKNGELVFVEVKARNAEKYRDTLPEENITPAKLHKLSKTVHAYLRYKNKPDALYHFDAISVWIDSSRKVSKIKHLENIFI